MDLTFAWSLWPRAKSVNFTMELTERSKWDKFESLEHNVLKNKIEAAN
mgnify:CR=1 FL=1